MHSQKENKVSVLFSGGKDSSLTAFILAKIFEVELVTATFGLLSNWKQAEKVAELLNFPFKLLKMDEKILEETVQTIIKDGRPANGIKYIHKKVLEEIAKNSRLVADGVRRNDRVPVLSISEIMSFEEKFKVHYIQPLMGFSRKTLDLLTEKYFLFNEYKGESFPGAEYEFEIREMIKRKYGSSKIEEIFPKDHTHSIVYKIRD